MFKETKKILVLWLFVLGIFSLCLGMIGIVTNLHYILTTDNPSVIAAVGITLTLIVLITGSSIVSAIISVKIQRKIKFKEMCKEIIEVEHSNLPFYYFATISTFVLLLFIIGIYIFV